LNRKALFAAATGPSEKGIHIRKIIIGVLVTVLLPHTLLPAMDRH
jgi:hypothetical protein